ncbi:MAG: hypothetical protein GY861_07925 [bacterium]|nr:hypothetical protein [bacterium]
MTQKYIQDKECGRCGFLALRNLHTRNLDEVGEDIRNTGELPHNPHRKGFYLYERNPICFAMEINIFDEQDKDRFLRYLNEIKSCDSFIEWKQGFTPKEHSEMQIAKLEKEYREESRKKDQEFQELLLDKQNKRQSKNLLIAGALAITASILGAIAGAIISANA